MNLEHLTDDELETVTGGNTAQTLTCDIAGGLTGGLVGIVATGAFGPAGGIIAGVFVGSAVKALCNATY